MVIRDLTLRSAASFGSFHLIRLLYDEYMFFLIEHQVALETGETPIAVMGEVSMYIVTYFIYSVRRNT
jgi:regulatory factor X 1/2/3